LINEIKLHWIFFSLLLFLPFLYGPIGEGLIAFVFLFFLVLMIKGRSEYVFLLFWYILILSDNFQMNFANTIKPVLMVLFALYVLLKMKNQWRYNRILTHFMPFLVLAFFILLSSESIFKGGQKYLSYVLLVLSVPVMVRTVYLENKAKFLSVIVAFCFLIVLACLVYGQISPSAITHGGRLRGIFGNPNGMAMFCLFSILFFEVVNKVEGVSIRNLERYLVYAVFFGALFLSGSRASIMAVVIFYAFKQLSGLSPFIGFAIVISLMLSYDILLSLGNELAYNIGLNETLRLDGSQGISTASGRLIAWKFSWAEIQKNFFLGNGWYYDELWIFGPIQKTLNALNHQGGVHNVYLIFWLNNGLVGVALFVFGLFSIFVKASFNCKLAFPILYAAMFQANFEPWLAASLNPYTICFFSILTLLLVGEFALNESEANKHKDPIQ